MLIDHSAFAPRLHGCWVALADDRETVLGTGKSAEEAFKKAQKKNPQTFIITHLHDEEIPNDDLLESIRLGEEERKTGKLRAYKTVKSFMASLD